VGLFGKQVQLAGGGTVKADEAYFRESILQPQAKIVSGFEPVMPTFQGLVTEEQLVQLVEYVKSLGPKPGTGTVDSGQKPAVKKSAGSTPANR
jgi:cytochrome c oxidase subunit 2